MRAAQDAARWQKELPRQEAPLFVSVNIASRQLFRQDLIQEIRHIVGRSVVPRGSLRLEVSEALVMDNPEQATEILQRLRAAGAELAIDEFGAGYSALPYLERLPFDTIKIDGALIKAGQNRAGTGSAMVRSIVALAHELGKTVVAQGVEGPDEVGLLRSIGCEYAQGFYYGEPMPDRDVLQLLKLVKKSERKLQPRGFFRAKSRKARAKPEPASAPAVPGRGSGAATERCALAIDRPGQRRSCPGEPACEGARGPPARRLAAQYGAAAPATGQGRPAPARAGAPRWTGRAIPPS